MTSRAKGIGAVLAAVVVLAVLALPKLRPSPSTPGGAGGAGRDQVMAVSMEVLRTESLSDRISTVGTVLADEEVELRSEISGRVEEVFFREGNPVAKGEILVKIDDAEL